MSFDAKQMYALLPAIYRTRDVENGSPLFALFSVIAAQGAVLEENIRQLYDDEFIETCAPWVVPYIGDLVGSSTIYEIAGVLSGRRAEIANTIGYRRRKGTLLALEQVSMDVSSRPAAAVEYFQRLITTESMRNVRPHHVATTDLRRGEHFETMGSAFDRLNRTVDVRRIAPRLRAHPTPDATPLEVDLHGPGRFNIPDVGIYLWRWQSFPVTHAPAFRVDDRRYKFSPLGQDAPIFNTLLKRESFSRVTTRLDVPQPISRRELHADQKSDTPQIYGPDKSLALFLDGVLIDRASICVRDLSNDPASITGRWNCTPASRIAIDPILGRIAFGTEVPVPSDLRLSFNYGFPAEIGGGSYDRTVSLADLIKAHFSFTAFVGSPATPTLSDAIAAWNLAPRGSVGQIVLPEFESFFTGPEIPVVTVPATSRLMILSAHLNTTNTGEVMLNFNNSRATVHGNIAVQGARSFTSKGEEQPIGQVLLSGICFAGSITLSGDPVDLSLLDCTLVPGLGLTSSGAQFQPGEPSIVNKAIGANLSLVRSISGPIATALGGITRICSSFVDADSPCCAAYAGSDLIDEGADLHVEDSTIIGKVRTNTMELASNTIFIARRARNDPWAAAVWCSRRQSGCVRFSFVPSDSLTPRRYRCLPETVAQEGAFEPKFITLHYGHPSYGLLSGDVPLAIWTGASDGSQMGAYNMLQETEAIRNVQLRAPEFLPFGLESGVFLEPSRSALIHPIPFPSAYGLPRKASCCDDDALDEVWFIGIGAGLI
ncbi:hypothetical protein [Granulicella sp. dw_53]|uniref:hypothetical protein n=1 Tax=Granulicella sp. dw_53 TaxID=2719792 RepID=UPI001BD283FD|nr:hypothetical protein [Granulicella sp. dw_53]